MKKAKLISLLFFLLAICLKVNSQGMEGDRILAIIGSDIITESDLQQQVGLYMRQNNIPQYNDKLITQIFQNMVAEKLMLAKGVQDSISATDDEVQKQLDYRIKSMVSQFGSEKNLEQEYGMTMAKIKDILKDDIKNKIIVDKVKQNKFGTGIKVTDSEVKNFFEEYQDTLPKMPETYELYQIVIGPKLTEEEKQTSYLRAKNIRDSIRSGADFSEMAMKYSGDSLSAIRGGDLGKVKKGTFVKEFEDAAYLLKPGEVSDIVETQFGYHIIKLVSKSGDIIETKHILIKFPKSQSADFQAINQLKDIRTRILNGEKTFQQIAMLYSEDKTTLKDSGYVGKLPLSSLDSLQILAVNGLKPGNISEPVRIGDPENYSYTIFYVKDIIPEHKLTLDNDYKIVENYALNYKENVEMGKWLDELKKTIYVDIKI